MDIPKILYHIWLGKDKESELAQGCVASWGKLLPEGYQIVHLTNDTVPKLRFVKEALEANTPVALVKANDYLRVWLLYHFGGVYMDNDIEVVKSLTPLLSHDCFLGAESDKLVNMAVLGAKSGSWFLKEVLDIYENFHADDNTAPVVFSLQTATDLLKKYGWNGDKKFEHKGVTVYPHQAFYPSHWFYGLDRNLITEETYTFHHYGRSWIPQGHR